WNLLLMFYIIALLCDNASVMTGKHLSFKKNWNKLDSFNKFNAHFQSLEARILTIVRSNCLKFYVTAAEEIRKRLPVNDAMDELFGSKPWIEATAVAGSHLNKIHEINDEPSSSKKRKIRKGT
ncbi:hypothetical protein ALC60_11624, partial [Trachymyrmex zeteki]